MKQGGYLDGVKKRLLSTGGILATITTMGNMFLQTRQVIDFRVQRCPREVVNLWNPAPIVSINVMNKSQLVLAQGNKQLAPLLPSQLVSLYQTNSGISMTQVLPRGQLQ